MCRLAENFDLEEPVWTISLFSSAHRLFSNSSPQPNAPLLSRCRKTQRKIYRTKADTNRPVTYTRTHTHTLTTQDNGWRIQSIFQEHAEEERRWTGQAIKQESWFLRTNQPSGFITNRVIMVFSRTEDKLYKKKIKENLTWVTRTILTAVNQNSQLSLSLPLRVIHGTHG